MIGKHNLITHHVDRSEDSANWGDSSQDFAGGWLIDCQFWRFINWPDKVRRLTLHYIKNNDDDMFIAINVLEYSTAVLINCAASIYFWVIEGKIDCKGLSLPLVKIRYDNKVVGSWTFKGCKQSASGRALGRLNVFIGTKDNVIVADRISCFK